MWRLASGSGGCACGRPGASGLAYHWVRHPYAQLLEYLFARCLLPPGPLRGQGDFPLATCLFPRRSIPRAVHAVTGVEASSRRRERARCLLIICLPTTLSSPLVSRTVASERSQHLSTRPLGCILRRVCVVSSSFCKSNRSSARAGPPLSEADDRGWLTLSRYA